jgi:predicted permease
VLTLGLGIGVNLAIFGIVEAVLLRPLPFPDPDRLVAGRGVAGQRSASYVSGPDFRDIRNQAQAYAELGALLPFPGQYTITGGVEPERITGGTASPSLFTVLAVQPQVGRLFVEKDSETGAENVLILNHDFWQRRFGANPEVVGQSVVVDEIRYTVMGVLPPDFFLFTHADLWFPMRPDRLFASERQFRNWLLVGRLAEGVSTKAAQSEADVLSTQLQAAFPETNGDWSLMLSDLHAFLVDDYRPNLYVLAGAACLVLFLACANFAGMLLARVPERRREMLLLAALGAPRPRLVRQLLTETVVLAIGGGAIGTGLVFFFQQPVLDFLQIHRLGLSEAHISKPIVMLALILSVSIALTVGILPALRTARRELAPDLGIGVRAGRSEGTRFRTTLVAVQVALSVILMIGAGLLIRSFAHVRSVDPGFDAADLTTLDIATPTERYGEVARARFFSRAQSEIRAIPGVTAVAATSNLPIRDHGNMMRARSPSGPDDGETAFIRAVLPGYFTAMDIPLLSGRRIREDDFFVTPYVAVISQTTERTFFPGVSAVGRQIELDYFGERRRFDVLGVVGDVQMSGLDQESGLVLYVPYPQFPVGTMSFAVRSSSPAGTLVAQVRDVIGRLDDDIPVTGMTSMRIVLDASVADRRIIVAALSVYALLPLILAVVGLYAVLAHYVARRRLELGVRIALGADSLRVATLVVGKGLAMVGTGAACGVAGALTLTRLIQHSLFHVSPSDPLTFATATLALLLATSVATCIPIRRLVKMDPTEVLRSE